MFTQPQTFHSNSTRLPYCEHTPLARKVFAWELTCIFAFVAGVHVYALILLQKVVPGSVVDRSIRITSNYLKATLFAFGIFVYMALFVHADISSDEFWNWNVLECWTSNLHGFFNFLAFEYHAHKMANGLQEERCVTFAPPTAVEIVHFTPQTVIIADSGEDANGAAHGRLDRKPTGAVLSRMSHSDEDLVESFAFLGIDDIMASTASTALRRASMASPSYLSAYHGDGGTGGTGGGRSRFQEHKKTFQGALGISVLKGMVVQVFEGGQADKLGVRVGWIIETVNGTDFTEEIVHEAVASGTPFTVFFQEDRNFCDEVMITRFFSGASVPVRLYPGP